MISGHSGAMTTVHATTAHDAAVRLETLSLMSDVALPAHVARVQVASAIQLVVSINRMSDGSRRVQGISECLGTDDHGHYAFRDLFRLTITGRDDTGAILGTLAPTGEKPSFAALPAQLGLTDRVQLTQQLFAV